MKHQLAKLTIENIGVIRAAVVAPEGSLLRVGGDHGSGKTTLQRAIGIGLFGKRWAPAEPIRDGADEGKIVLDLGAGLVATRKLRRKDGGGYSIQTTVTEDGEPQNGAQGILDKLYSERTIDPLGFVRLKPADRIETLKGLVGIDWTEADARRQALYDERTGVNRDVDRLTHELQALPPCEDAPTQHTDTVALVAEQRKVREHNAIGEGLREQLGDRQRVTRDYEAEIADYEVKLETLKRELKQARKELKGAQLLEQDAQLAVENHEPLARTVEQIEQELASAAATNAKVDGRAAYLAKDAELQAAKGLSAELSAKIHDIDAGKRADLAAAKFPIDGLGFGERDVTLGGYPWEQASGKDQLVASVAIGLALNPDLTLLLIRDGSILRDEWIETIAQMAADADGLAVIEDARAPDEACQVVFDQGVQIK